MYTTSPAFSIPATSRKVFVNDYDDSPGPMYNTFGLGLRHKSQTHLIGKSMRTQINHRVEKTPAPCQYNPQKPFNQKKVSFPKSHFEQKIDYDVPDVGYYQPNYDINKQRLQTFSMGSKYPSIMDDVKPTPGPGAYETARDFKKSISSDQKLRKSMSAFSTTAVRFHGTKKAPGPGDYDLLSQDKILSPDNKGKFGISSRYPSNKYPTPGPGQYENKKIELAMKSKLGTTMLAKPKKSMFLPAETITDNAFGTHEVVDTTRKVKPSSPQYKIGQSKRRVFEGNKLPGPFDYLKENYKDKNTFRATIPSSNRLQPVSDQNPGPGSYYPSPTKQTTYTIPRSQSGKHLSTNPGVGRYDVDKNAMHRTTKGNKFYTSHRTNFVSRNVAGVGDYDIEKKARETITFTKSERFLNGGDRLPGPGDYHIPSSIGKYNNFSKSKRN